VRYVEKEKKEKRKNRKGLMVIRVGSIDRQAGELMLPCLSLSCSSNSGAILYDLPILFRQLFVLMLRAVQ